MYIFFMHDTVFTKISCPEEQTSQPVWSEHGQERSHCRLCLIVLKLGLSLLLLLLPESYQLSLHCLDQSQITILAGGAD